MIEIPPPGSIASEVDLLNVRISELRIAVLEEIEDLFGPVARWLTWWPI